MTPHQPCVVLDRIADVPEPPYCIHGKCTCAVCMEWCWLGSETVAPVSSRIVLPLCQPCALRFIPPESKPLKRYLDNLRVNGPHA